MADYHGPDTDEHAENMRRHTMASANRNPHALWLLEYIDPERGSAYRCLFSNTPGQSTLQREGVPQDAIQTLITRGVGGAWRLSRIPWKANPADGDTDNA